MKKLLVIIIIFFLFSEIKAQQVINLDYIISMQNHSGKKVLHFSFKAIYLSIGKISQREMIKKMSTRKLISKKNYTSAISFAIENKKMYLPYKDSDDIVYKEIIKSTAIEKRIRIFARAFYNYNKYNNEPFFLIEKIELID